MPMPIMILTDLQRNRQHLTSKSVLPRIPTGISLSFPNIGMSFQLKQKLQPRRDADLSRLPAKRGERAFRRRLGTFAQGASSPKGISFSAPPLAHPQSRGGPLMLLRERRGDSAAAIQPGAPGSQQLSCSRTLRGKYRGRRPPRPGSTPPSGRRGRRHLPVSSSHGSGGQAGTALNAYLPSPSPAELTASADGCFPVTTTTNKQPPARNHCAGARHLALKTLAFRRGRISSPPRSAGLGPALSRRTLTSFSAFFPPPLKD